MNISKHLDYLVSFHTANGNRNERCSGDELAATMANKDVYSIEQIKCWEIYTCNPDNPEEGGWEIKWVESTPEKIKHFPLFDCCITGGYPNDDFNEVITFLDVNV